MEATSVRTPQEVFGHHAEVLIAGDLEGIVADYSDDAVFITPDGVLHGKDGVRQAFTKLLSDLPSAEWEVPTQIFEGDVLFIEWKAVSESTMAEDGIDIGGAEPAVLETDTVRESDVVITMGCGDACPVFPGKRYEDWELDDPAGLPIDDVRPIRDAIRSRVEGLLASL